MENIICLAGENCNLSTKEAQSGGLLQFSKELQLQSELRSA